jgi:hypothetical protein
VLGIVAMIWEKNPPATSPACLIRMWAGSELSTNELGLDLPLQHYALSRLPSPTGLPMLVCPEAAFPFYYPRSLLLEKL